MKMHHPHVTHARHTLALVVATVLCRLACGGVDGGGEAARSNCIRGKPIAARYTHRPKRLCVKYDAHTQYICILESTLARYIVYCLAGRHT